MSNYHVEPASKPQALTKEALKSMRNEAPKGLSRRQLLRTSLGAAVGLWILEVSAGTLSFLWPNLSGGFGGEVEIGTFDEIKNTNAALPIAEGYPAYYQEARAFVMLVDPSRQEFVPGEDQSGDGTALNVRALYQRCPHLGCKPNPCLKIVLARVRLPRLALRPPGDEGEGARPGAAGDGPLRGDRA